MHHFVAYYLYAEGYGAERMIEELKNIELVRKLGGRFKLTALIQRRLEELMSGARPLIEDSEGKSLMEIVIQEIMQDKIAVDYRTGGNDEPAKE